MHENMIGMRSNHEISEDEICNDSIPTTDAYGK